MKCFWFLDSDTDRFLAPRPGAEPATSVLEGEVKTPGLPGKSLFHSSYSKLVSQKSLFLNCMMFSMHTFMIFFPLTTGTGRKFRESFLHPSSYFKADNTGRSLKTPNTNGFKILKTTQQNRCQHVQISHWKEKRLGFNL